MKKVFKFLSHFSEGYYFHPFHNIPFFLLESDHFLILSHPVWIFKGRKWHFASFLCEVGAVFPKSVFKHAG
jgi:hypothetical protein